jgi:hypothetical protein
MRSPGWAVSRAEMNIMSRLWAVPVSPQTSCRLSTSFSGVAPSLPRDLFVVGLEETGKDQVVHIVHGDARFSTGR